MRTLFTILTLGLSLNYANAQKIKQAKVPATVKEAFNKQYPNAKVESWEKEDTNYEAVFELNNVETSASYDRNGRFISSEVEIKKTDLPKAVADYIATNMPGKKIKDTSKITDANGKVTYEALVGREDFIFDSDCSFVRKEDNNKDNH
ncbi:MAG: PepSY-like domain-containing protein [Bacteroidota bacterium]